MSETHAAIWCQKLAADLPYLRFFYNIDYRKAWDTGQTLTLRVAAAARPPPPRPRLRRLPDQVPGADLSSRECRKTGWWRSGCLRLPGFAEACPPSQLSSSPSNNSWRVSIIDIYDWRYVKIPNETILNVKIPNVKILIRALLTCKNPERNIPNIFGIGLERPFPPHLA